VEYAGPAGALLRAWKERGLRHLAACAADLVVDGVERPAADVITYIPPDPIRQLGRGAHPAGTLARELAGRWELDLVPLLGRKRSAERQASLRYERRRANLRDVFVAQAPPAQRVLLIDDVYTTGSTANAAASALRAQGARSVVVVTFARAIRS